MVCMMTKPGGMTSFGRGSLALQLDMGANFRLAGAKITLDRLLGRHEEIPLVTAGRLLVMLARAAEAE